MEPICLHRNWRVVAVILILACLAMIFLFSGQDGQTSDSLSTQVTVAIIKVTTKETPNTHSLAFFRTHHVVRKIAHATEYGLLAASCALLMHTFSLSNAKRYGTSCVACLPFAALDEFLQTFRAERNGSVIDVGIDMLGVLFALLLFYWIWNMVSKHSRRGRWDKGLR